MVDHPGQVVFDSAGCFDAYPGADPFRAVLDDVPDTLFVMDDAESVAAGAVRAAGLRGGGILEMGMHGPVDVSWWLQYAEIYNFLWKKQIIPLNLSGHFVRFQP
jgi:hypothetical protein